MADLVSLVETCGLSACRAVPVVEGARPAERCEPVEADAVRCCGLDSDTDLVRRDGTDGVETVPGDRATEREVD